MNVDDDPVIPDSPETAAPDSAAAVPDDGKPKRRHTIRKPVAQALPADDAVAVQATPDRPTEMPADGGTVGTATGSVMPVEPAATAAGAAPDRSRADDAGRAPPPLFTVEPLPASGEPDLSQPAAADADAAADPAAAASRPPRAGKRGRRGGGGRRDDAPAQPFTERANSQVGRAVGVDAGADRDADADGDDDSDEWRGSPDADAGDVAAPPVDAGERFAEVLSGAYDVEPADDPALAVSGRRVLPAEADAPKLQKVLAQAGIGSRRDMEQLIVDGQITVNGQAAHVGQRISYGDQIKVAGRAIKFRIAPPPTRVLAYHKPVGEIVTNDDPQNRPTVFRKLPRLGNGKWQAIGRLDINTEGLLLFTNSGDLANQLMHPRFGVEREYAVRVLGTLEDDARARLLEGVDIGGAPASFRSIDDGGGEGVNRWYRVVITEGRNREVRKLFDAVGLTVNRLIRIRYGAVVLPRGLKRGVWIDLEDRDVRALRQIAGLRDPQPRRAPEEPARPARPQRGARDRGGKRAPDRPGDKGPERPQDRAPDRPAFADRGPDRGPGRQPPRGPDRSGPPPERREPGMRREPGEGGPIPNPLQQTYDRRAIREAQAPRREFPEDGPIPNPLEQTYDKRFVQKPKGPGGRKGDGNNPAQPDPMQTSMGYIGADTFYRKMDGGAGGGRGGRRKGR